MYWDLTINQPKSYHKRLQKERRKKGAARKKTDKSAKNPNRPGWTGPGKLAGRQAEEKRRDGHPPQNKEHH